MRSFQRSKYLFSIYIFLIIYEDIHTKRCTFEFLFVYIPYYKHRNLKKLEISVRGARKYAAIYYSITIPLNTFSAAYF